ncbi:MAG: hypothetical protein EXR21_07510 [Flavobacteriaceae bacterium]|nr:hypothetical protein [Flavobacteriaceae bacterium]
MRLFNLILCIFFGWLTSAQELYVATEPASNMPAKSISIRLSNYFMGPYSNQRTGLNVGTMYRSMPEFMWGISKKSMLHLSTFTSNMHQQQFKFEGVGIYFKYRFITLDQNHRHFRMAAFGRASLIANAIQYNDINLNGDNTGIGGGVVVTQLLHKLALSFTSGYVRAFNNINYDFAVGQPRSTVNYSLSGGYLFFPVKYKNNNQPSINYYLELLGKYNPVNKEQFVDISQAIQVILNSRYRLDLAYRRQVAGNMIRISNNEFLLRFEYNLFNAYK